MRDFEVNRSDQDTRMSIKCRKRGQAFSSAFNFDRIDTWRFVLHTVFLIIRFLFLFIVSDVVNMLKSNLHFLQYNSVHPIVDHDRQFRKIHRILYRLHSISICYGIFWAAEVFIYCHFALVYIEIQLRTKYYIDLLGTHTVRPIDLVSVHFLPNSVCPYIFDIFEKSRMKVLLFNKKKTKLLSHVVSK